MLVSGITETKENSIYYFMYDLDLDEFTQERCDRKLIHPFRDRQGNRDYSKMGKIYCQLSENKVKSFNKQTYYWENMSVYLMRVYREKMNLGKNMGFLKNFGCGGDKKKEGQTEPPKQHSELKTGPDATDEGKSQRASAIVKN